MLVLHAKAHSQQSLRKSTGVPVVKDWYLSTGNWQTDPQLYVCEYGTGPDTVVMLHGGWGGEYSGLLSAVAALGDRFHFIFYDQRGSLRSPFADSLITFDQHILDVERLRTELNIKQLNLVGHSMGAVLASAYAAKFPDRIRRLILLSPPALKSPLPNDEMELLGNENGKLEAFLKRPAINLELEKYQLNRCISCLSSREETMKFRIQIFSRMVFDVSKCISVSGDRALYKQAVYTLTEKSYPASGWNFIDGFSRNLFPVTMIAGDHDFVDFGNVLAKKWNREVPEVRLKVIQHAGHFLWLDSPGPFQKELMNALTEKARN